jgi:DNA-binding NtrC family response regulator
MCLSNGVPQIGASGLGPEIFDFVIVSLESPKFEGRSVLERTIEIDKRLPVLVLARCVDIGCYMDAVQLGALDYLEKPLLPQQLLRFVKSHLRAQKWRC